jgi:restriction endonuclease Mrr
MIPPARSLQGPVLQALRVLGGAASNAEIEAAVARELALSEELLRAPHRLGAARSELAYRLAWARTKLKSDGLIERAGTSSWRLTPAGAQPAPLDAGNEVSATAAARGP